MDNVRSPERELWQAVLDRAIRDALQQAAQAKDQEAVHTGKAGLCSLAIRRGPAKS